jgi:hypothetical protein
LKNIFLFTVLALALGSCQDKTKKEADPEKTAPGVAKIQGKAPVNFESHPIAKEYRTVISEKYDELEVNFASHYIITTWGCGSGCVSGAMVDIRDGNVYPLPHDEEWGGNGTYINSKKGSKTLLTILAVQLPAGGTHLTKKYWEWDEELKQFESSIIETTYLEKNQ